MHARLRLCLALLVMLTFPAALRAQNYGHTVSIEMRAQDTEAASLKALNAAITVAQQAYGLS